MPISRKQILKNKPVIIAGPCAVESRKQILSIAKSLHKDKIKIMRCQLWKPRSDKESFQGVREEGLPWLKEVKEKYNLLIATEITNANQIEMTKGIIDILWVGSRNMQNFELLKELSKDERVVIIKRGFIATVKEWIASAKYIGLDKVILCERGIRTGADSMRFTLDINSALVVKHDHKLPVLIDPSHSAGRVDMVAPLSFSAIASGIDGLIIEVHNKAKAALSDKDQQITPKEFSKALKTIKQIHKLVA